MVGTPVVMAQVWKRRGQPRFLRKGGRGLIKAYSCPYQQHQTGGSVQGGAGGQGAVTHCVEVG